MPELVVDAIRAVVVATAILAVEPTTHPPTVREEGAASVRTPRRDGSGGTAVPNPANIYRIRDRDLRRTAGHVDSVTSEPVATDWRRPHGPYDLAYRIEVEGDPSFSLELGLGSNGSTLSAMPVINAVPAVCAARPGLLGPLDVPRYWGGSNRSAG